MCTSAFAGPPARPMVISGELLADGAPVAEGAELKITIAQAEAVVKTKQSEGGTAYYRIVLAPFDPMKPDLPRFGNGDSIRFLSLGQESLADMPPLAWKPGTVVINVLLRTVIQEAPSILAASATQDADGKWVLKSTIRPIAPKGDADAALSYRIKWFVRKAAGVATDDSGTQQKPQAVKAAEETLSSISTDKESVLSYGGTLNETELFELYVTPLAGDGKNGPSVRQTVYPVQTKGAL
ncbi:MAG: hypothetical protein HY880_05160 [Deltaproteobacteria bacterium]|nr:hypothetical protein [Deltaproteobacteria bacterium]